MTEQYRKEIEERAKAATPGPWKVVQVDCVVSKSGAIADVWEYPNGPEIARDNALFIAHAREDIPALLAEVKRLQKALDAAVEKKAKLGTSLYKAAKTLSEGGFCTHYPGYTCDKGFPSACPECIKKWLMKGE